MYTCNVHHLSVRQMRHAAGHVKSELQHLGVGELCAVPDIAVQLRLPLPALAQMCAQVSMGTVLHGNVQGAFDQKHNYAIILHIACFIC